MTLPKLKHISLLIVEDSIINQIYTQRILAPYVGRIACAKNGGMALDLIKRHCFDLILMDIVMPHMDGYETTTRIRQYEEQHGRPSTPILALTAYAHEEVRQLCLEVGMQDLLKKPITPEALLQHMDLLVPEKNAHESS